MEKYTIGLMFQHESKWFNKSWLQHQISVARKDAQAELSKKFPGIQTEVRHVSPEAGKGSTLKEKLIELIEKFDFVIFEFSDNNPNVMIEFGIRLVSQKPYLIIRNEKTTTKLPSDVSNEFYLEYSTQDEFFSATLANYIIKTADLIYEIEPKGVKDIVNREPVAYKKKSSLFDGKLFEIFVDYKATTSLRNEFYKEVQTGKLNEKYKFTGIAEALAWQNLCEDPKYLPYHDSVNLLRDQLPQILANIYSEKIKKIDFVCLGVGNGRKEQIILDNLLARQDNLNFFLVDDSIEMMGFSLSYYVDQLKNYDDRVSAVGVLGDLNSRLGTIPNVFPDKSPSLFALLGNTIGNYPERSLIRSIRSMMEKEDFILIDAQLLPEGIEDDEIEEEIRKSYESRLFKRFAMTPLLRVGIKETDGRIELNLPRHHPYENGRAFTVQYNWVFSKDVEGICGGVPVTFDEGSRIELGISVKYDIHFLCKLVTDSGLKVIKTFLWRNGYYGIVLAQRIK